MEAEVKQVQETAYKEGYTKGKEEGKTEARKSIDQQTDQNMKKFQQEQEELKQLIDKKNEELSQTKANHVRLQERFNSLEKELNAVRTERNDLLSKLKRAIDRIDRYERE